MLCEGKPLSKTFPHFSQRLTIYCLPRLVGKFVFIEYSGANRTLSLCEVQVYSERGTSNGKQLSWLLVFFSLSLIRVISFYMEKNVNRLDMSLRHSKTLIFPHGIDLHSSYFKLVRGNREGFSTNLSPTFFLGKRSILQQGKKHPFDSYLIPS